MAVTIRNACFPEDAAGVLAIFREYVESPSVSLAYQNYEAEFAALPGDYAMPGGRLLLAEIDGQIGGCVALRRVDAAICEMKRLYVRPAARGLAIGRRLVERLLVEAVDAGYQEIRLDVLDEFSHAQRLYYDLGFVNAEPVSYNPVPGTRFLGRKLLRS